MQNENVDLKRSLSEKHSEVETLNASVEELKEGLLTQHSILEEHRVKLIQAENEKVVDEEEIMKSKAALEEARSQVENGEVRMQTIMRNMKNLESTYKAENQEVTRQLHEKVMFLKINNSVANFKMSRKQQI